MFGVPTSENIVFKDYPDTCAVIPLLSIFFLVSLVGTPKIGHGFATRDFFRCTTRKQFLRLSRHLRSKYHIDVDFQPH
jgi:hypothetical protein